MERGDHVAGRVAPTVKIYMKSFADYKIYNNLVFLIPIAVGLYIHVTLFTILAILIFLSSSYYHVVRVKTPDNKKRALTIDMVTAFACYSYLSYFILYQKEAIFQLPLFIGLLATIIIFMLGKYRKSEVIHALFHASIAVTAGFIGIL